MWLIWQCSVIYSLSIFPFTQPLEFRLLICTNIQAYILIFLHTQPDPTLPSAFNASNDDYWDSGWSRGHMAAAGNYKHCQKSMDDTFFLTNIVPQDINNNCK